MISDNKKSSLLSLRMSAGGSPHSVIVICTKDRPDEVRSSCLAAHHCTPTIPILVVDASTTGATQQLCAELLAQNPTLELLYHTASRPGLARQRNEAIELCKNMTPEIIHFIDDDTEVKSKYFSAIESRFRSEPAVMGIGGVILNQLIVKHIPLKRLFFLASSRPGTVLPSGRPMLGQYAGTAAGAQVDWLNGCSMSFRATIFDTLRFDDRLEGSSVGEDLEFTFRVGRAYRLAIEPKAECIHHRTPTTRAAISIRSCERIENGHRWVSAHQTLGLSRAAFWWATFGDLAIFTCYGLAFRDRDALQRAKGTAIGVERILRRRLAWTAGKVNGVGSQA